MNSSTPTSNKYFIIKQILYIVIPHNFSHFDSYVVISHCGFNLHFTNDECFYCYKYLFMCLFVIYISFLVKCFQFFSHFFNWVIFLFCF